jgi:hypothetical protein
MNRIALIHLLAVALVSFHSISIMDTHNPKKVEVLVHYDGRDDDKIEIDRDKLEGQELADVVKKLVKLRTKN